jgi:hypothetical protein
MLWEFHKKAELKTPQSQFQGVTVKIKVFLHVRLVFIQGEKEDFIGYQPHKKPASAKAPTQPIALWRMHSDAHDTGDDFQHSDWIALLENRVFRGIQCAYEPVPSV